MKRVVLLSTILFLSILFTTPVFSQGLNLPRVSQNHVVTQTIGLAKITVDYSSPAVNEREIWGKIVPMGQVWRAGANENTTITFSHDAKINGKEIKAGTYGLHLIPAEDEWTVIFSNNSTSWGSFSYQEQEDALRVKAKPKTGPHTENLAFRFLNPTANSTEVILAWEKIEIPFTVEFDTHEITLASIRNQLRNTAGFSWQGFQQAANYCLQNEINYEEALTWVNQSIAGTFGSQRNFTNLQTKSQLLAKMGKKEESEATMTAALDAATNMEIYQYGASFIAQNQNEKAMEIFKFNAKKYPNTWLSHGGLGAGYRVTGNYKDALKHYKKSKENAPDAWKPSIDQRIQQVEKAMAR